MFATGWLCLFCSRLSGELRGGFGWWDVGCERSLGLRTCCCFSETLASKCKLQDQRCHWNVRVINIFQVHVVFWFETCLFWPCLWKMGLIPHSIVHHVFWRRQPNWQTCLEDRFLGVSITSRIMHFFGGKDRFVFNQKLSERFLLDLRKQHPLRL